MSSSKIGQLKPFMIEEKKEGPTRSVSEVTANKWQGCMVANIKKEEKWVPLMNKTWEPKKVANRGLTGATAADDSTQVDQMLEYVSQYAPSALYRDITLRATGLTAVWTLVRDWAGLKTSGCKQNIYFTVKRSYDPNGDLTPTDFFFSLRNAKEDCLLLSAKHGGNVNFHGSVPNEDEDLTPTLESDIVLDWLDSLGGTKLVEHTFRVFAKELETESLADLRQRISDNLANLMTEADQQAELNRAFVQNRYYPPRSANQSQQKLSSPSSPYPESARPHTPPAPSQTTPPGEPETPCKLCLASKTDGAHTHSISTCFQLNLQEVQEVAKAQVTRVVTVEKDPANDEYEYPVYEDYAEEENELSENSPATIPANTTTKTCLAQVSPCNVYRIHRINITESPILACSSPSRTVYLVLNDGATASIITLKMCQLLNLQIYKTGHSAVHVDGESKIPVLGEVHTSFTSGSKTLYFSGLVVSSLGVDILAGTNFHVENDVYSRMAKGTIHIGDHCTIQSSPPSFLTLETMDTGSKQRLVKIPTSTTVMPEDSCTSPVPHDLPPDTLPAEILAVPVPVSGLTPTLVSAWKQIQQSCPDLRCAHALLMSGRSLSKKEKKASDLRAQDIRTYLRKCTLNIDGLIVSLHKLPEELIIIPRPYAFTFSKALHVNLNHPLPSEMRTQFSRHYYMLDEAKVLQQVLDSCDIPCQAYKIPQFTTVTKSDKLGQFFTAHVMEDSKILVIYENLTSYTDSLIIKNQTKSVLREALIVLTSRLKLGNSLFIRVDGQSFMASLQADKSLESLGIFMTIGQLNNVNKNARADTVIRELREQLVCLSPQVGAVNESTLARATAFLNSVIRHTGRSANELWRSRDQLSGANIQMNDQDISNILFEKRQPSHLPSAKNTPREGNPVSLHSLQVGSMVCVKDDCSKSKTRDSYFVLNLDKDTQIATVLKFPTSNFRHLPIHVLSQNLYLCTEAATSDPPQALPKQAAPAHHAPDPDPDPAHVTPPRFVISPTPTNAPYDPDKDHTKRCPMPLFPGSPQQPEAIAEVPPQLRPGGDAVHDQPTVPHLDDAEAFLQPNLDMAPVLKEM